MKKVSVLLASAVLALSLTACGTGNKQQTTSTDGKQQGAAAPVKINLAYGPAKGTPFSDGMEYWAKILKEQSNGSMVLVTYPSDQLGSQKDVFDQALAGSPVITTTDVSFFADMGVKDFAIVQAPYLAKTWDEMIKLSESDWWADLEKKVEGKGLKVLAHNWMYGERHTITTKPVKTPQDLVGLKIRVPQSTVFVQAFKALGAAPTPLALGEVYSALQQKTIDGLENPLSTIYFNKYQEVAKYLLLDSHMKTLNTMAIGTKVFNGLTKEQQDLLIKTAKEAGEYQNKLMLEEDKKLLEKFKAEGVTVTEINFDEFQKAAGKFYTAPEFKDWTPGLYETVKAIMAKK